MLSQIEIREQITAKIVEALKNGTPPWRRPWVGGHGLPMNAVSGRRYNGINVLLLQLAALERGFSGDLWATCPQWNQIGGRVMKRPAKVPPGHWGTKIILYKPVTRQQQDAEDGEANTFLLLREFTVFHLDQVEGIDKGRFHKPARPIGKVEDYGPAEAVIAATGADIRFAGGKAFYHRQGDYIQVPPKDSFHGTHEFYSTLFHEILHWSESRLGWQGSYAIGELIAEIGASFLAAETGIPQSDDMTNHAAQSRRLGAGDRR